jgi:hypothetical protein
MGHRALGGALVAAALAALLPAAASAAVVTGPHQRVENTLTTKRTSTPTGFLYRATYHAANRPKERPPYMRKMQSWRPRGMRFDTSVPARCTASDVELAVRGAAACPKGSLLGRGTTTTAFFGEFPSEVQMEMFNNTREQIILVRSPGLTSIARGRMRPDNSIVFESPTCFPSTAGCPVDNTLQLGSRMKVPPYVKRAGGKVRTYARTPSRCPARGHWRTPIRFWWDDGSSETVVTKQPCRSGK